jgi:membrane-associated phospholipid phosphatase
MVLSQADLIFKHVPNNPFPSDHAALSSAIGFATLFWGIKTQNRFFIFFGIIFIGISLFMSVCRVAAGVHWPTDILM